MESLVQANSSPSASSSSTEHSEPPKHNPYQRMASRRAIACVTCAKAKTKCDKGLPSCSRCITKGIKCDPRSTRRTSDNSYRANIRKPFVSPKRYHSTSNVSPLNRHTSPRSIPTSSRPRTMRAASSIDFRTAVKMSQQATASSALPMLTPLPTYTSQIVDECYTFSNNANQTPSLYTPTMDSNCIPNSCHLTPQTPEALPYHEPLTLEDMSDPWTIPQLWSDDALAAIDLGYNPDMIALLPSDVWTTPEHAHSAPVAQMPWTQSTLSLSPQSMVSDLAPHPRSTPSLSMSDCSAESYDSSGTFRDDWSNCAVSTHQYAMADMATSAPFLNDFRTIACAAPVWEDVFIPGAAPY